MLCGGSRWSYWEDWEAVTAAQIRCTGLYVQGRRAEVRSDTSTDPHQPSLSVGLSPSFSPSLLLSLPLPVYTSASVFSVWENLSDRSGSVNFDSCSNQ